ncbi:MAG: hypothetical protein LPJ89_02670, partial [Hymenobacteraceae bacterium]|nr:hypothetical protein [Hymenobacteraceae bacterium]MDX5397157.1 hypothetical protein [Hymenobacteraceae bacterium]MDX5442669.1 hypothetical protein [Hymenobacteraceae bacterium]MDX5513232.1 hypothetical protein [Hymenobacteraceae bacterium]
MGVIKLKYSSSCTLSGYTDFASQLFHRKLMLHLFILCFTLLSSFGALAGNITITTTNASTGTVNAGSTNNGILRIAIDNPSAGQGQGTETITGMAFTSANFSNADVTNAKLYYTSTSSTFATSTLLGTDINLSDGISFSFTGIDLGKSNNSIYYFWLTYDISSSAASCNNIGATVGSANSFTFSTSPGITLAGNPSSTALSVSGTSVAGTASTTTSTICAGSSATLQISGHSGTILWQQYNGSTWVDASGTNNQATYTASALQTTTQYRARVQRGNCTPSFTNTVTISVTPLPNVVLGNFTDVCRNTSDFALTGGTPTGGTYSGPGVSNNRFNPASVAAGTYTITYTVTQNGCTNSATNTITVVAPPTVSLSPLSAVCVNDPTFALSGGAPSGGTYSGPGVSNGDFNSAVAGTGTHTITYSYTDPSTGCSNTASRTVTVNGLPTVSLSAQAPICVSANTRTLTGGSPAGGTYSGTGVSNGVFDPAVAGVGNHILTYSYTNGSGCTNTATTTISVTAQPVLTFNAINDVCVSNSAFSLTSYANPAGGTFSGTGVSGNNFNPATAGVGTHTITFSYSQNGCTVTATQDVEVNALPVVSLGSFSSVCVDEPGFALTGGMPTGGTYSGPGVSSGNFVPSSAGAGTHTITYTYTDLTTGCSNSATSTITVKPLPTINFAALAPICESASPITLSATPTGGTFSGTGVSNGSFDPAVAGEGLHEITYTVTVNGCTNSLKRTIEVTDVPSAVIQNGFQDVCLNDAPFTLTGATPTGGTFSGTGVTNNIFNPSVAGVGTHTITYTVTQNGCTVETVAQLTVNAIPVVSFSGLGTSYCVSEPAVTLSGSPAGGTFSGPGISGNTFSPSAAGAGNRTIMYTYTDPTTGCSNTSSQTVRINALPVLSISGLSSNYCV